MTLRDAAHKAGFNQSAFTRWKKGAKADPEFVVKFARGFGLNVLEALVEAEFITEKEAQLREVNVGGLLLSEATEDDLADEVLRRMNKGGVLDMPIDEFVALRRQELDEYLNSSQETFDDLAKRRHTTPTTPPSVEDDPYADGNVPNWDDINEPYAADSSPNEQEERLNRGEEPIA